MSPKPSEHPVPRTLIAALPHEERRGWLRHGLAALAISALGLAVAGSVSLTTSAETTSPMAGLDTRLEQVAGSATPSNRSATTLGAAPQTRGFGVAQQGSTQPFERPDPAVAAADARVRAAVVKERAAQRAEDLSKTAEDVTRATRDASSKVREKNLAATDRQVRENAVRIATERRKRAIAARIAAEYERKRAEAAAAAAAAQAKAAAAARTEAAAEAESSAADEQASSSVPDEEASPTRSPSRSSRSSGRSPMADSGDISSSSGGVSPVPGAVIGAHFGQVGIWARYHTGLDFRAGQGTPIRAVKSGVVLYAGNSGNWAGNHVAVKHRDGMTTMSSHMSSMAVSAGQNVRAGQVIGYVGQTGRAFGAHLHFELYPQGVKYGDLYRAINPAPWLSRNGVYTR